MAASASAPAAVPPPAIRLRGAIVEWSARGGRVGFSLSLGNYTLRAGERAALVGPSGGGKSTLLSLLSGAAPPAAGSGPVDICGTDLRALSGPARDRLRADRIGLIFQQFNLLPAARVADNILLPLAFSARRSARLPEGASPNAEATRLLAALGLDPALAVAPAETLSVGQQQRVAAARALIGRPDLILADEPTSALDPENRDRFLDLLLAEAAASGAAVLLATHDPATAARFDRVDRLDALADAGDAASTAA